MNFREHFETAWRLTLKNIAPLLIMSLVMVVVAVLSLGILEPVLMAGFLHAGLLMVREGREPRVQDLFSHMKLFFPLLGFSILLLLLVLLGFTLFVIPGIVVVLLAAYCCLFMLPLMTDREMKLFEAIKESYAMMKQGELIDNLAVFVIFIGLLSVGSTTMIGFLFTQPFATIFLMSVYIEKTGQAVIVESEAGESL